MFMTSLAKKIFICLVVLTSTSNLWASLSYPGCGELTKEQFKATTLVVRGTNNTWLSEPVKMALHQN